MHMNSFNGSLVVQWIGILWSNPGFDSLEGNQPRFWGFALTVPVLSLDKNRGEGDLE